LVFWLIAVAVWLAVGRQGAPPEVWLLATASCVVGLLVIAWGSVTLDLS
jgi:hypothetical protein